jgi:hypothetical protein
MKHLFFSFVLFGACGVAVSAEAAPFCLAKQQLTPQCIFYDPNECNAIAIDEEGVCVTNPVEFTMRAGMYPFCVVDTNRYVECIYADRPSCVDAALERGGVCVLNEHSAVDQDPYLYQPEKRQ